MHPTPEISSREKQNLQQTPSYHLLEEQNPEKRNPVFFFPLYFFPSCLLFVLCDERGYPGKLDDYAVAEQADSIPATSRKAGSWLRMRTKAKRATENTPSVLKTCTMENC